MDKSATWREVRKTALKIGTAFIATGVWWMVGLFIQAQYGLPTLRLTENYRVVSDAATAPELFRGLGYWYFYGQGRVGAWIEPSTAYTRWALPLVRSTERKNTHPAQTTPIRIAITATKTDTQEYS